MMRSSVFSIALFCRISHCYSSLEKELINIGAVDLYVAHRACLILLGLVVKGGRSRDIRILRQRVALKAQQIRLRPLEQPRICGSMRGMTRNATLSLDRLMFEDK